MSLVGFRDRLPRAASAAGAFDKPWHDAQAASLMANSPLPQDPAPEKP